MSNNTFDSKLTKAVLDAIVLTGAGVVKVDSFDPAVTITGTGAVTAEITAMRDAGTGTGKDFFVSVSVIGLTYVSSDPDKLIIQTAFDDCLKSICTFNLTQFAGLNVVGFVPVSYAAIRHDEDKRMFSIDFQIAVSPLIQ